MSPLDNFEGEGCALCGLINATHVWDAMQYTPSGPQPVRYTLCHQCQRRFKNATDRARRLLNEEIVDFFEIVRRERAEKAEQVIL